MHAAHEERDYRQLARLSHWLKGAGGTAGFPMLSAPAVRLETAAKGEHDFKISEALDELARLARCIAPSSSEDSTTYREAAV